MTEAINAHKKMAMGMTEGNVMKKGGKVKKYASGGRVKGDAEIMNNQSPAAQANKLGAYPERKIRTLINDSSQKRPLPKVGGKIATMKRGGAARGR